ncbi:MAG: hypothetical protein IPP73_10245 [Chitinophagaceae bacterium]|nr:hypothetical protein [Chitinophagaceae bacterium]
MIGTFISGVNKLQNEIEKTGYKHIDKRKHELIFNSKTFNPYLFDKMDLGLCLEWLGFQKEKLTKDETEEYLILIQKLKEIWK